ncbi:hypothetical protein ACOME3_007585 [Neoechinorhynchus agilis]
MQLDFQSLTVGLLAGSFIGFLSSSALKRLFWRVLPTIARPSSANRFKMVMVVRTDLGMGRGKIGAQCAHAAVGCYVKTQMRNPEVLKSWNSLNGQAKIVLRCGSKNELFELNKNAKKLNLITTLISDAGRTQIEEGSLTVLGIGPDDEALINQVTGKLQLL